MAAATAPALEFWYEFASTYSYPAAMRVEEVARARGVDVVWRPFLLGPLFFEQQGLRDSPFNVVQAKGDYMWRDLARVCEEEGLPLQQPSQFPRNSLLAARLALVGAEEGWIAPFSRAVYDANFARDEDISGEAVLRRILAEVGADPDAALAAAASEPIKAALKANVADAKARGLFGAPSFVTPDGDLYWGNDRLERAVAASQAHAA
jgi:2-hydroxychromene-2-carboxylate isomerase